MKICPKCMRQYDDAVELCEDDGERLRTFRDQASRMMGKVLDGRWKIEAKIAEGGMGEVYRARQVTMGRVVAIKLIRSGLAGSEEFVARFFREANILATIQHPHLVTIYDYGQAAGEILYIAMEYLDGQSLGERMARSRLGLSEIVKIGAQICAALDVAHDNQVVHRDLKPDNVFLVDVPDDIFVKVLDFGIAKQLDSDHTPVTRTGQVFGTPEYMSPEQCENVDLVDQRSDLYSLGVILYELLSGALPYDAVAAIKIMVWKISQAPVPLSQRGVSVPERLEALVMKLLAMKRDDRPPNARAVRDELEEIFVFLRDNPELVSTFGRERLAVAEHGANGTRRLASDALDDEGVAVQHKLLDSGEIAWDDDSEVPFATTKAAAAPDSGRGIGIIVVVALVMFAGAAMAIPSVRQNVLGAFVEEPEPVPLGPSPQARRDSLERATSTVDAAYAVAFVAPAAHEASLLANDLRFDAAVFATALPSANPPVDAVERPPTVTKRPPKKPASPKTGVLDFRTKSSIERKVRKLQSELVPCYEARADASLEGAVGFEFRIDPEGKVDYFSLTENAFDPGVAKCVEGKVRNWTFRRGVQGSGYDTHRRTVRFSKSKK